ncbi:hypothetical protein ACFSTI_19370 [Rhizorhabdus histidinilytica]
MRRPMFDLWQRLAPRDLSGTPVHVVLVDRTASPRSGPGRGRATIWPG